MEENVAVGGLFFSFILSSITRIMLLGDIPIRKLKDVSVKMWNAPLDKITPCFVDVEIVGMIENFHAISVCI